ncbi:aldose 1-epimerase [Ancylostoma ceylanicum]|nr:aldose 1-epimerase [Ancylostoma ceylanicum]
MRSVTIESFGETRDERRIVLIRITNGNGMRLELLNLGATVRSIVVPDREGVMTDVALGFDSVKAYEADPLYIGSTLGRVAGRIRDARYAIDSREYFLAQNDHPHHRNGGAKSPLSKKVWNYTLLEEGNGVVFNVRSHDGEEGYPGNANVQVSYVLTNHNEILVQFSANTDKSTLMNLSSNFYLNLDGEGSSLENHELQVTATSYLETEKDGAVTGEMIDLPSTSRDPQPLCRDRMGKFDHIYCFDPLQTKSAKKFRHMMR